MKVIGVYHGEHDIQKDAEMVMIAGKYKTRLVGTGFCFAGPKTRDLEWEVSNSTEAETFANDLSEAGFRVSFKKSKRFHVRFSADVEADDEEIAADRFLELINTEGIEYSDIRSHLVITEIPLDR